MSSLVVPENVSKYEEIYRAGYNKSYPSLDLVRLEGWYFRKSGGCVLDYGFGTGVNSLHLLERGYRVYGLEAASNSLEIVGKKLAGRPDLSAQANFRVIEGAAERLPFDSNFFDHVICLSVLSLLATKPRIQQLVQEFHRVLKPGGSMIIDINGPEAEFASKGRFVGEDTFEYHLRPGQAEALRCYVPKTAEAFGALFSGAFQVDDLGWTGFRYAGMEEYEFIACVRKPA